MKDVVFFMKMFLSIFFPLSPPQNKNTGRWIAKKNNRVGVQKNNKGTPVDVLLDATQHEHVLLGLITTTVTTGPPPHHSLSLSPPPAIVFLFH